MNREKSNWGFPTQDVALNKQQKQDFPTLPFAAPKRMRPIDEYSITDYYYIDSFHVQGRIGSFSFFIQLYFILKSI